MGTKRNEWVGRSAGCSGGGMAAGVCRGDLSWARSSKFGIPGKLSIRHRSHAETGGEAVPCGLPGCDTQTTHKGGYCCAAHCEQHKGRGSCSRSRQEGFERETR